MLYADKVEEHIKVVIFISKTPWLQVRKHKSLKFFRCSAFILFFFFIYALTHFSYFSLLLLLLLLLMFFSFSLLNYNGRRHVFIYVEKVEEHIRAVIFISKNPRVQLRKHKSLNFFLCSAFILFSDFSRYKSLHFFVFLSLLQCAHCFLCSAFCVFILFWLCNDSIYFLACCMQTRWKNTLKLPFSSQKLHDYRFVNIKV